MCTAVFKSQSSPMVYFSEVAMQHCAMYLGSGRGVSEQCFSNLLKDLLKTQLLGSTPASGLGCGPRTCIPNKALGDADADLGPHFENHHPRGMRRLLVNLGAEGGLKIYAIIV